MKENKINDEKNKMIRQKGLVLLLIICLITAALCISCNNSTEQPGTSDTVTGQPGTPDAVTGQPGATDTAVEPSEAVSSGYLWPDDMNLCEAYKDYFMIGSIYTEMSGYGKMLDSLENNFNIITPENIMKPEYMQPSEGVFNYKSSDAMLAFAEEHGFKVHGHTLAWHNQSGNWLGVDVERDVAIEQLKSHITNIVGQYKGRIYSWDVVNEAIADGARLPSDGDWTKCLRETQWLDSIGPDYIAMAFQFAHEADPDAVLYYNDYNLDDQWKAKVANAMVKDLLSQDVPIHGIGMQGHYNMQVIPDNVESSINMFAELGVRVSVTELDVSVKEADSKGLTEEQEKKQAVLYAKLFKIFKEHSDVVERVTFWGHIDTQSWRKEYFPCIFNGDYSPKEAVKAIYNPEEYLALP